MKLDATDLRYVTNDEFRVLTATEMGSKNHEVVPTPLIAQLSGLRSGGVNKCIGSLAKRGLVAKVQNSKYDGYRLTYGGLDYLAMRALSKRGTMTSVGNQIGVGKEADVYVVANDEGESMVLKLHRLGRISFRSIKNNRDYLGKRKSASWMYMSRLGAEKEYAFMKVLHEHGFPVPRPIDQARHTILMELIDAYPLRQIAEHPNPGQLYSTLMSLIVRLARAGLIHGDFNEFNILIREPDGEPVLIDFPQMVSVGHENAEWYFNRDVQCIRTFFRRRFGYESKLYPRFKAALNDEGETAFELDVEVEASGFGRKEMGLLQEYMDSVREAEGEEGEDDGEEEEEEEEDGEEEEVVEADAGETLGGEERVEDEAGKDGTEEHPEAGEPTAEPKAVHPDQRRARFAPSPEPEAPAGAAGNPTSTPPASPPASSPSSSRSASPSADHPAHDLPVKQIVTTELNKRTQRQRTKYHSGSGSGASKVGRAKGSKKKQDIRGKISTGDIWG
ncbi:RIO1-domain-containing protein [Calocera cornea HHB12733]|uniref:Serine/threonine-protein kinase RIO2 n=1 Tax=Calocera cornea HHB12733 TaxID=1353952 RepID=A0A165IVL4_9BASI|nr:RIO1-domain-containing protein [Calocera cornea HHB12733]